jgi:AraC-like DNA-binding protein
MDHKLKSLIITGTHGVFSVTTNAGETRDMDRRKVSGILIATSGTIIYNQDGKKYYCDDKHIVFAPKNSTYTLECLENDLSFVINFESNIDTTELIELEVNVDEIVQMVSKFYNTKYRGNDDYHINLCVLIYRIFSKSLFVKENNYPSIVIKAIKYISNNLSNCNLQNKDIANHCAVSIIYLQKLFSKHLNKGLKEYILFLRMNKAEELLLNTDLPIAEIANLTGFASNINFSRCFKINHKGIGPFKYRKNYF